MYIISNVSTEEMVLSQEDAKRYLRVTDSHDDELIDSLINASVSFAETIIKQYIVRRKIIARIEVNRCKIHLPYIPINSINYIKLLSDKQENNDREVRAQAEYFPSKDSIILTNHYLGKIIEIEYIAGMENVPASIIQAIKMYLLILYDKEEITEKNIGCIRMMLSPYKLIQI